MEGKRTGPPLVGREEELARLEQALDGARAGKGSTILISGEPGIGKTALVEAFKEYAATQNVRILSGAASADSAQPFLVFLKALEGVIDRPLFEEEEHTGFLKVFAINHAGMLVAQASSGEEEMDADIFAGMLSAVQNFIGDSLGSGAGESAGLGRLEYGDMKILIEHGRHLFLTGVFSGAEHPDMKGTLKRVVQSIEAEHGATLEKWSGRVSDLEPVQGKISRLTGVKFLVRRNLEGMKLDSERIRMADGVLDSLMRISSDKPVAIVLEDLHWADESSLVVLTYIARNVSNLRIFTLCTSRDSEEVTHAAGLDGFRNEARPVEIRVSGIHVSAIARMIDSLFPGNGFSKELAEKLSGECGGNPLFIRELLCQMEMEGAVVFEGGRHILAQESFSMPASVGEIVERRLEGLDPDAMALAEYASCIGREFTISVLHSVPTVKDIAAPLEKLCKAGIIRTAGDWGGFSHALFRDLVYSSVSGAWKVKYHRALGEHIERRTPDAGGDVVYELARHFSIANEKPKALDYSMRAGERAESAFAVDKAIEFYGYAAEILREMSGPGHDPGRWMSILEKLGDLSLFAGDAAASLLHFSEALDFVGESEHIARLLRKTAIAHTSMAEFDKAAEAIARGFEALSDSSGLEYGRLCIEEAAAHSGRGDFEQAASSCERAVESFSELPDSRKDIAKALRAHGTVMYRTGKYEKAIELFGEALEHLDPGKDEDEYAQLLHNIGVVLIDKGEYAKAMDHFERGEAILEKIDDKLSLARLRNSMGIVSWLTGNPEQARSYYFDSLITMRRAGRKAATAMILNNIGATFFATGEIIAAQDYYFQSLEIRREIGDKAGIVQVLSNLGTLRSDQGDMDAALRDIEECIELSREIGDNAMLATALLNKAETFTFLGRTEGVQEMLEESLSLFVECGDAVTVIDVHYSMTNSHILAGRQREAMESATRALECATALEVSSQREVALAHAALGKAERLAGRADAALREFHQAAGICSEIKDRSLLAKVQLDIGGLHADEGNIDSASASLSAALELFEAMGMKLWAERCRKALEELDQ